MKVFITSKVEVSRNFARSQLLAIPSNHCQTKYCSYIYFLCLKIFKRKCFTYLVNERFYPLKYFKCTYFKTIFIQTFSPNDENKQEYKLTYVNLSVFTMFRMSLENNISYVVSR